MNKNIQKVMKKSLEEFDKLEKFSAETKIKEVWTFTVDISECEQFIKTSQQNLLNAIKEEIESMPDITESEGWEGIKEQSCCPGDDFADGYNKAMNDIIKIISK